MKKKSIGKSVSAALDLVSDELHVEVEEIRSQCQRVLGERLYWFPVRHHSPAVARQLERVMRERRPKIIFLEAPGDVAELLPFVSDPKTKPPIAIYSSFRDDDNVLGLAGIASASPNIPARFSCWLPLLPYSPEYIAIMVAREIGAQVICIDLPHYALLKHDAGLNGLGPDESDDEDPSATTPPEVASVDQETNFPSSSPAKKEKQRVPKKVVEVENDRLLVESQFYEKLSEVAGYRSWNEAWDSLFEITDYEPEKFRRELATFCAAARATSHPDRVLLDGTLQRERYMKQTIESTLRGRNIDPSEAMVVCGGFHLFLDREDAMPPPAVPTGTVYNTVVPYSYFRVSELSGYAAGNRAPAFYQRTWELIRQNRAEETLIEHVLAVMDRARKSGEMLSSADAIAVCQTAEMLARLRKRSQPVLDDITDAIITCCCKGNPDIEGARLLKAMQGAAIGSAVGRVTPTLGQLPIVKDFYDKVAVFELNEMLVKEKRYKIELDKRKEQDNDRSVFLHRLVFLSVPFAKLLESRTEFSTGKLFAEKWDVGWTPQVDSSLIEKGTYGDSVESAALATLRERMATNDNNAEGACLHLLDAMRMDLPNVVTEVQDACSTAIDNDSRFLSLTNALSYLLMLDRYAVYRGLRKGVLDELIVRCFNRACFAILDAVNVPEESQDHVVAGLIKLADLTVQVNNHDLDRNLFVQHVTQAGWLTTVPFLRGAFLGILVELREKPATDLAMEVSALAKASVEHMVTAGDFLEGVMAVSRSSILLGADALIDAIDELLRAAEWEVFLNMIPKMRAAMIRLHERQREALARCVAQKYGLEKTETLTELKTSVGAAAIIADIDRRVAEIMKEWEF